MEPPAFTSMIYVVVAYKMVRLHMARPQSMSYAFLAFPLMFDEG
jgi:hypothetical protein